MRPARAEEVVDERPFRHALARLAGGDPDRPLGVPWHDDHDTAPATARRVGRACRVGRPRRDVPAALGRCRHQRHRHVLERLRGGRRRDQDLRPRSSLPAVQGAIPERHASSTRRSPYDDLRQKLRHRPRRRDPRRTSCGPTSSGCPEFADQGALLALDEEMPDFDDRHGRRCTPARSRRTSGATTHYGLPLDTNTRVLFYNNAVFEEAGVTAAPRRSMSSRRPWPRSRQLGAGTASATPRAAPARGASCPGSGASAAASPTTR